MFIVQLTLINWEGSTPRERKRAKFVLMFKRGDREMVLKCKPVPLTALVCKLPERLTRSKQVSI